MKITKFILPFALVIFDLISLNVGLELPSLPKISLAKITRPKFDSPLSIKIGSRDENQYDKKTDTRKVLANISTKEGKKKYEKPQLSKEQPIIKERIPDITIKATKEPIDLKKDSVSNQGFSDEDFDDSSDQSSQRIDPKVIEKMTKYMSNQKKDLLLTKDEIKEVVSKSSQSKSKNFLTKIETNLNDTEVLRFKGLINCLREKTPFRKINDLMTKDFIVYRHNSPKNKEKSNSETTFSDKIPKTRNKSNELKQKRKSLQKDSESEEQDINQSKEESSDRHLIRKRDILQSDDNSKVYDWVNSYLEHQDHNHKRSKRSADETTSEPTTTESDHSENKTDSNNDSIDEKSSEMVPEQDNIKESSQDIIISMSNLLSDSFRDYMSTESVSTETSTASTQSSDSDTNPKSDPKTNDLILKNTSRTQSTKKDLSENKQLTTDVIPTQSTTESASPELKTETESLISGTSVRQSSTQSSTESSTEASTQSTNTTQPTVNSIRKPIIESMSGKDLDLSETPISSPEDFYFNLNNENNNPAFAPLNPSSDPALNATDEQIFKSMIKNRINHFKDKWDHMDKKGFDLGNKTYNHLAQHIASPPTGDREGKNGSDPKKLGETISESIDLILPQNLLFNEENDNRTIPQALQLKADHHLDPNNMLNTEFNKSVERIITDSLKSFNVNGSQKEFNFFTTKKFQKFYESLDFNATTHLISALESTTESITSINTGNQYQNSIPISTKDSNNQKSYQRENSEKLLNFGLKLNNNSMNRNKLNEDQEHITPSSMIELKSAKNNNYLNNINNSIDNQNNSLYVSLEDSSQKNSIIGQSFNDKNDIIINNNKNTIYERTARPESIDQQQIYLTEGKNRLNENFEKNPKISDIFYETASRIAMYDSIRQLLEKAHKEDERDNHNYEIIKKINTGIDANQIRNTFNAILGSPGMKRAVELSKLPSAAEEYKVDDQLVDSLLQQLNQMNELDETEVGLSSTQVPLNYTLDKQSNKEIENKNQIKANERKINSFENKVNINTEKIGDEQRIGVTFGRLATNESSRMLWSPTTETIETQLNNEYESNKRMKENSSENKRSQNNYYLLGANTPYDRINTTKIDNSLQIPSYRQTPGPIRSSQINPSQTLSSVRPQKRIIDSNVNKEFAKSQPFITKNSDKNVSNKLLEQKGILSSIIPGLAQVVNPVLNPISRGVTPFGSSAQNYGSPAKDRVINIMTTTPRSSQLIRETTSRQSLLGINSLLNNLGEALKVRPTPVNNQYIVPQSQNNQILLNTVPKNEGIKPIISKTSPELSQSLESTKNRLIKYNQDQLSQNNRLFDEKKKTTTYLPTQEPRSVDFEDYEHDEHDHDHDENKGYPQTYTMATPIRSDQNKPIDPNILNRNQQLKGFEPTKLTMPQMTQMPQIKQNLKSESFTTSTITEKQMEDKNKVPLLQNVIPLKITTENPKIGIYSTKKDLEYDYIQEKNVGGGLPSKNKTQFPFDEDYEHDEHDHDEIKGYPQTYTLATPVRSDQNKPIDPIIMNRNQQLNNNLAQINRNLKPEVFTTSTTTEKQINDRNKVPLLQNVIPKQITTENPLIGIYSTKKYLDYDYEQEKSVEVPPSKNKTQILLNEDYQQKIRGNPQTVATPFRFDQKKPIDPNIINRNDLAKINEDLKIESFTKSSVIDKKVENRNKIPILQNIITKEITTSKPSILFESTKKDMDYEQQISGPLVDPTNNKDNGANLFKGTLDDYSDYINSKPTLKLEESQKSDEQDKFANLNQLPRSTFSSIQMTEKPDKRLDLKNKFEDLNKEASNTFSQNQNNEKFESDRERLSRMGKTKDILMKNINKPAIIDSNVFKQNQISTEKSLMIFYSTESIDNVYNKNNDSMIDISKDNLQNYQSTLKTKPPAIELKMKPDNLSGGSLINNLEGYIKNNVPRIPLPLQKQMNNFDYEDDQIEPGIPQKSRAPESLTKQDTISKPLLMPTTQNQVANSSMGFNLISPSNTKTPELKAIEIGKMSLVTPSEKVIKDDDKDPEHHIKEISDHLSEISNDLKTNSRPLAKVNGIPGIKQNKRITRMRVKVYDIEFDDGTKDVHLHKD